MCLEKQPVGVDIALHADSIDLVSHIYDFLDEDVVAKPRPDERLVPHPLPEPKLLLRVTVPKPVLWGSIDPIAVDEVLRPDEIHPLPKRRSRT